MKCNYYLVVKGNREEKKRESTRLFIKYNLIGHLEMVSF
jgi:hypothetical protein